MESGTTILTAVAEGKISSAAKCDISYMIHNELLDGNDFQEVQIDYDPQLDEIFLRLQRNDKLYFCLPRCMQGELDFNEIGAFRKAHLQDSPDPILLAICDYAGTTLVYDIHEGSIVLEASEVVQSQ